MAGCSDDPFNALVNSFTEQISMLKHLCMMRSTDSLEAWQSALRDLDARVTQIERHKADLRTTANRELRYVGQSRELVELLKQQQEHAVKMEAQLPPDLRQSTGAGLKKSVAATPTESNDSSTAEAGGRRRKKGFQIPALAPVSKEELSGCPSYIRGRITVQKVNAAIDEILSVVQEKYRILSLPTSKMGAATRTKHQVYSDQQKEAGDSVFFTDDEIKASQHVKFDATGKAILATLQSLGRLKIDGGRVKKYVLLGA
ncbi:uncharacterized protein ACA1_164870 [Acanthamoeba castellanii str. Neff]|uniref:Spindle and kinetochore-associated protein 1 n=1 Tax=Acanthamoeba castellanii (strain ATCC 30010 / Neff) TaxID=1257118 RepID=L8GRM9_ACACF|nr:uncharacterized protein ACA1_164870 [Acanthamoeba castellanii str. Neff]ELR15605.1 hypothetical protein ACA1_164870 [Acanthamoeba castellanii str. Neff]